jgi:Flp pilus assembly protein TadG
MEPAMFSHFKQSRSNARQRGVLIVEFALVALLVFLPLLLGIMEFGRWMYTLNAAAEATRWGARAAVVCDINEARVQQRIRGILGGVANSMVITYSPQDCTRDTCLTVTAHLEGATFTPLIPYFGEPVPIPPFTTTLPRESLDSAGSDNEVCQ